MKFLFKETQNSTCTTLPPFLNSTQQPGCILAMLFCPRDFVELASGYMAALDPMYSNILSQMIHVAAKIVKRVSAWKNTFC